MRKDITTSPPAVNLIPMAMTSQEDMKRKGKGLQDQETPLFSIMNFIIKDVKGANIATFRCQCDRMVKAHKLLMLVLLETKTTDHKRLREEIRFDAQI